MGLILNRGLYGVDPGHVGRMVLGTLTTTGLGHRRAQGGAEYKTMDGVDLAVVFCPLF